KSRNEQRCSDLTVRHSRHRGSYFPAEMSSARLRGWFVVSKHDGEMRGVRKLLAERDEGMERGVLTRTHICPRGVLTMGRLANFDPPSYSIRSTNRSDVTDVTPLLRIGE
ncbi:hypothetical protein ALC62_13887, partial [Cyphomyrmex costatus]